MIQERSATTDALPLAITRRRWDFQVITVSRLNTGEDTYARPVFWRSTGAPGLEVTTPGYPCMVRVGVGAVRRVTSIKAPSDSRVLAPMVRTHLTP